MIVKFMYIMNSYANKYFGYMIKFCLQLKHYYMKNIRLDYNQSSNCMKILDNHSTGSGSMI